LKTVFLRTVRVAQSTTDGDPRTLLSRTVGNTGNMLFETALDSQLSPEVARISSLSELPQGADTLVLSMSNFISPVTDMGSFAEAIERRAIGRVVMVGCGAQAHGFDIGEMELKPGTRRFIDLLSERSVSIGVRGTYTADMLNKLGVKNVKVIGCPSIYWPADRGWPDFRGPTHDDRPRYGIHCTPTGKYRDAVRSLFAYGRRLGMYYLCQTEIAYMEAEPNRDFRYYMRTQPLAADIHEWMLQRARIFYDLDEWIRFNSGLSFVLGSRFHGNVVTMLAGRPALNMVFDSRTREMIEHFSLPFIDFADFDERKPVQYYKDMADYSLFHAFYRRKLGEYADFLTENGVPHLIGAQYRNCVQHYGELDPVRAATAENLIGDAISANLALPAFQARLRQAMDKGRSADERDAIERGIAHSIATNS